MQFFAIILIIFMFSVLGSLASLFAKPRTRPIVVLIVTIAVTGATLVTNILVPTPDHLVNTGTSTISGDDGNRGSPGSTTASGESPSDPGNAR